MVSGIQDVGFILCSLSYHKAEELFYSIKIDCLLNQST